MTEFTYNPYLLYRFKRFSIIGLQIDNTLMLVKNTFAIIKKDAIKTAIIMTNKNIYFTPKIPINFNNILIQLAISDDILPSQKTCIRDISLVKNHEVSTTSLRSKI